MDTVKIRTIKGTIITLEILKQTDTHLQGLDKYGKLTIVALRDIDSMFTLYRGETDD